MFTGLIEAVGYVADVARSEAGWRLKIRTELARELTNGESVSVNGVCLTATRAGATDFEADIGPETARVTTLGSVQAEQAVNLERAMRADARFGGHFVQGHVDGLATLLGVWAEGDAHWLRVGFAPALAPFFVAKGSVALDGVSLTVAALGADHFDVMIIPFTWSHTSLSTLQAGSKVNVECDVVGKYVARAVQLFGSG
jgi:riboflavin synthase